MISAGFIIVHCLLFGTILFNDNFEDSLLDGWSTYGNVQCVVDSMPNSWQTQRINPDFVRIQYHGIVSMKVGTTGDQLGHAIHSFPVIPDSTEYMVEFYFHVYAQDVGSFYNYNLYRPCTSGDLASADIVLLLNSVENGLVALTVIDREGQHTNVFFLKPDTVFNFDYGHAYSIPNELWHGERDFPIERWYRFQIHKVKKDSVVLYVNGNSISTYVSLSGDRNPDQIYLGANDEQYATGFGHYDDFIITTPPIGEHPRLLCNDSELPELRSKRYDDDSEIQRTYKYFWDMLMIWATNYNQNRVLGGLPYPYNEPPYSSIDVLQSWFNSSGINAEAWYRFETIGLRWLVNELDPSNPSPDPSFLEYLRTAMYSFANWNHWNKPCEYRGLILKHPSRFEFCLTFAYDLLFDSLSNFEKMSVQNAILSQGIVPGYLLWRTRGWDDPWVPFYPGHPQWMSGMIGFMALVLDDDSLRNTYADFSETIVESLFVGAYETDMIPVFGPDGDFAHGSLQYAGVDLYFLTPFWEANRRVRGHNIFHSPGKYNSFMNYPIFRLYAQCPGSGKDFQSGNSNFVTAGWHDAFCCITNQQNSYGQWFLKRLYSHQSTIGEFQPQKNYRGLNFLFFDDDIIPQSPPFALGKNFGNFWVCMRTGLGVEYPEEIDDNNEVAMIFDTYGKKTLHIHQSRNNFVLGTAGSWHINETIGYMYDYHRSVLHNVIVVDSLWDPNPYDSNEKDAPYGQSGDSRCTLQGFHSDNDYCYSENSVDEGCYVRMKKFVRKVIFTKEGYAAIKDEVESSHPQQARRYLWLVHVPNTTPVYGDSLIWDYNEKYQIKFLLPVAREIVPFSCQLYGSSGPSNATGIYVANSEAAVATEFLSFIITRRTGYQWPPSIERVTASTMSGAEINGQSVILYSNGQTGNVRTVTYTINHPFPQGLDNILAGLRKEALYNVYINNDYVTSFNTRCGTGFYNINSTSERNQIMVRFVADLPFVDRTSSQESSSTDQIVLQISPSVFSKLTNIRLQANNDCSVTIRVYDVSGRLVKAFDRSICTPSKDNVISWDGCDYSGKNLASGVYFLQLESENHTETRKVLIMR